MDSKSSVSVPASRRMVWPENKPLRKLSEKIGNSMILRSLLKRLAPMKKLRSDAVDITYVSWMVPLERVEHLVPPPLTIQKFYSTEEAKYYSIISILSFTNGNFGPVFLGPLRKWLCSSPPQSNCRLYIEPISPLVPENDAVFYLSVNMDNPVMTLSGRLFSDGLPVHYVNSITHAKEELESGVCNYSAKIDSGGGSGLDLNLELTATSERELDSKYKKVFSDYDQAARFIYDRNRAICIKSKSEDAKQTLYSAVESIIDAPASEEREEKLIPTVFNSSVFSSSPWLETIVRDCSYISFVISNICINVAGEKSQSIQKPNN